jgi:hypothetical protein
MLNVWEMYFAETKARGQVLGDVTQSNSYGRHTLIYKRFSLYFQKGFSTNSTNPELLNRLRKRKERKMEKIKSN